MALLSLVLPAMIGMINRKVSDSELRFWISFVICLIAGVGFNFLEHAGDYSGLLPMDIANTMAESVLVMTGLVKLSFEALWDSNTVGRILNTPQDKKGVADTPLQVLDLKNNS